MQMAFTQSFKVKDCLLEPRTKPNNTLCTKIHTWQKHPKELWNGSPNGTYNESPLEPPGFHQSSVSKLAIQLQLSGLTLKVNGRTRLSRKLKIRDFLNIFNNYLFTLWYSDCCNLKPHVTRIMHRSKKAESTHPKLFLLPLKHFPSLQMSQLI